MIGKYNSKLDQEQNKFDHINSELAYVLNDEMKTWEHLVIFESEMTPPPKWKSKYKSENFSEWLTKYSFDKWRIADIDNFMFGNPLFDIDHQRNKYQEPIFEGSTFDYKANIDLTKKY